MANISPVEKELRKALNELGTLMQGKNYNEAYTIAGKINSLLKSEEVNQLSTSIALEAQAIIKNYYGINAEVNKVGKKAYGMGAKAIELANS